MVWLATELLHELLASPLEKQRTFWKPTAKGRVVGVHENLAIRPGAHCHPGEEVDVGGHCQALVVVSVLADDIDPARCAVHVRRGPVAPGGRRFRVARA